jgi:hypothetical protein
MSMAEAIAVVSETSQASSAVTMPAMPQERQRISANAFKNLTARLKTTGNSNIPAAVPTISVTPVVAPVVVVQQPVVPPIVVAPTPTREASPALETPPALEVSSAFEISPALEILPETSTVVEALDALESVTPAASEIAFANTSVAPANTAFFPEAPVAVAAQVSVFERVIQPSNAVASPQKNAFPELVNPLEVMAAQEAARIAEEARLKAEAEAAATSS